VNPKSWGQKPNKKKGGSIQKGFDVLGARKKELGKQKTIQGNPQKGAFVEAAQQATGGKASK